MTIHIIQYYHFHQIQYCQHKHHLHPHHQYQHTHTHVIPEDTQEPMPTMVPSPQSPMLSPPPPQLTDPLPHTLLKSLKTSTLIINDALLNAHNIIAQAAKYMTALHTAPTKLTKYLYTACVSMACNIHSGQTGAFPVASISGSKCLFSLYDGDDNYIDSVPIPSRTQHQILKAY